MDSDTALSPAEIRAYYAARVPQLSQRPAGELRGPCPIHNGTDDNFAVHSATGKWFCHSVCGKGGDIYTLEAALSGIRNFTAVKEAVFQIVGRPPSTAALNGS